MVRVIHLLLCSNDEVLDDFILYVNPIYVITTSRYKLYHIYAQILTNIIYIDSIYIYDG